jgi:hypothetical protein
MGLILVALHKSTECETIAPERAGSIDPAFIFATKSGPCLWRGPFSFGGKMTEFQAVRVTHEYTQTNCAPPETVFPLLCPVREADWVPGWQYRLIYSQSGFAEAGCVFITEEDGRETTWIVTEYDPVAFRIAFAWVNPGAVAAQIRIRLERSGHATTAHIQYTYTALSQDGNREVEGYDGNWFRHKMQSWEAAINHYLKTGKCIDASSWE